MYYLRASKQMNKALTRPNNTAEFVAFVNGRLYIWWNHFKYPTRLRAYLPPSHSIPWTHPNHPHLNANCPAIPPASTNYYANSFRSLMNCHGICMPKLRQVDVGFGCVNCTVHTRKQQVYTCQLNICGKHGLAHFLKKWSKLLYNYLLKTIKYGPGSRKTTTTKSFDIYYYSKWYYVLVM